MVVSNTSPLNYLIQIGAVNLLPDIHKEIHVPGLVIEELVDASAPFLVRTWAMNPPDWLRIETGTFAAQEDLVHLHRGEAAAIILSLQVSAELLLIDDLDGRIAARKSGLTVMGTLGLIDAAAIRGLVDFHTLVDTLLRTNFRAPQALIAALRERHH